MSIILKSDHIRIVRKIKRRAMIGNLVWAFVVCCLLISPYILKLERDIMLEAYGALRAEFNAIRAKQDLMHLLRLKPLTISQALDIADIIVSQREVPVSLILGVISRESDFKPGAISNKGARGLMQLMPATYKIYSGNPSLASDRHVHDPVQNVQAGLSYLTDLKGTYDDWRKVLRAYFAGPDQAGNKTYDWYANAVFKRAERYEKAWRE